MLPATNSQAWTLATDEDKEVSLALLSSLPRKQELSAAVEDASYSIAMQGMTRWGLERATENMLQNSLGHPFFPSPAELRAQYDAAMAPLLEQRKAESRQAEIERQRQENKLPGRRSPEELARHAALMERFNSSFTTEKDRKLDAERAEIRARHGMTEEVLAKIKDAPKAGKQIGRAIGNVSN